jgi:hypothetical protein
MAADLGQVEGLRPLPWLLDVKPRAIVATIRSYEDHFSRTDGAGGQRSAARRTDPCSALDSLARHPISR